MRNIKIYILVAFALMLLAIPIATMADTGSERMREYQIKAAFLYNFVKFVDWPEEKIADSNEPVTIGIIGKCSSSDAFKSIKSKRVKGREVVVKRFKGFIKEAKRPGEEDEAELRRKIEALRKCHLLFICSSEKENIKNITGALKGSYVLTVGETAGFLETGGIINFLMEDKKVRFEISITTARRSKLKVRSQLLRLAKKVVEEKEISEKRDKQDEAKSLEDSRG